MNMSVRLCTFILSMLAFLQLQRKLSLQQNWVSNLLKIQLRMDEWNSQSETSTKRHDDTTTLKHREPITGFSPQSGEELKKAVNKCLEPSQARADVSDASNPGKKVNMSPVGGPTVGDCATCNRAHVEIGERCLPRVIEMIKILSAREIFYSNFFSKLRAH